MEHENYRPSYDEYPVCDKCHRSWQLLDWGCALHRLTCGDVAVPDVERARIIANSAAQGVVIYWR